MLGDLECESIHYTGGFDSECPELLLCCSGTWDASRFTTLVGSTLSAPSYYPGARGLGMPRAPMTLFHRRAGSLEPPRRRRASAKPRARRSLIAPPTSSTHADRVVVRRVRPPGRTAGRRPTSSSRSAASLLLFHRRAGSPEPPRRRRARAEPRARRSLIAPPISPTNADRVVVRRVRRPGRTAEHRLTSSSRSASLLLCLSPRQLTRADTTTASAPSREHVVP